MKVTSGWMRVNRHCLNFPELCESPWQQQLQRIKPNVTIICVKSMHSLQHFRSPSVLMGLTPIKTRASVCHSLTKRWRDAQCIQIMVTAHLADKPTSRESTCQQVMPITNSLTCNYVTSVECWALMTDGCKYFWWNNTYRTLNAINGVSVSN